MTSVIKLKDKSGPLLWWAVGECEAYARQKLSELTGDQVPIDTVYQIIADMRYQYKNTAKRAGEIGTLVHAYLHQHLAHTAFDRDPPVRPADDTSEGVEANNAIDAGLQFFAEHEMLPITMEQPVWSATHGYVGTDDFIGYVDGELCTCDYKTSKSLYPEVWLQTAAYQHAYQEEHPRAEIKARWGINVGKDGKLHTERRGAELFDADFRCFLGLLDVYRWDRVYGHEPKEQIEIVGALPELNWVEEMEAA